MTAATWLAYDTPASNAQGTVPPHFALTPRQDFRRVSLGLCLFLGISALGVVGVAFAGSERLRHPETLVDLALAGGTVVGALAVACAGAWAFWAETRRYRKDVTLRADGLEVRESGGGPERRWAATFGEFVGVVLCVVHGETEDGSYAIVELRHPDSDRSLLLHRERGTGLAPETRRLARALADQLHTRAFVEVRGSIVPLSE